ncbi:MAG: hypothetical protein HY699_24755 [Deltaproteobacteria bacterium]|nr:hypothetical protein [Deltaproteobacteria bacterium]
MRVRKGSRVAVAVVGSVLLAGVTAGCTAQKAEIDPAQMTRIENAASKAESAALKAEAAAKSAADAAARAEAAAQRAQAMFDKGIRK